MLVGCSSTPADEEPNFTDTTPHSTGSDSDVLADADADTDSALAAQVGGICGIRDTHKSSPTMPPIAPFALDIYKHAMDATYRLETPDPTVTAAWQSDITVKNPNSGESYDLHCIMATNQKSVHYINPDEQISAPASG